MRISCIEIDIFIFNNTSVTQLSLDRGSHTRACNAVFGITLGRALLLSCYLIYRARGRDGYAAEACDTGRIQDDTSATAHRRLCICSRWRVDMMSRSA